MAAKKDKKVLGIILARGGSKSIPKKSIYPVAGNPMLYYTAMPARKALMMNKTLDRLIISTDDEEIAGLARVYTVEVPFMRPKELAKDDTPDLPVMQHALEWLKEKEKYEPDIIVHLRPTTPFKSVADISRAVELLLDNPDADSARSVIPSEHTPFKMYRTNENDKFMRPILMKEYPEIYVKYKEPHNMPRQQLPTILQHTGYIDALRTNTTVKKNSMSGQNIMPLVIEKWRSLDIDSMEQLLEAERVIVEKRENGKEPWQL